MKIDHLAVIWSSGDPAVAHKACLMYTHGAKRQSWFAEVRLIVWGPSADLLAQDTKLQAKIRAMIRDGICVEACKACADSYGVSEQLEALGVEVKYMGAPLTEMLKDGWRTLCF